MRTPGGGETERHVLVDGGNLVHRAFYSHVVAREKSGRPAFTTSGGVETGTVFGSMAMLGSWLHDMGKISRISVFFDGRPSRRLSVDPSYKSNRVASVGPQSPHAPVNVCGNSCAHPVEVLSTILSRLGCDVYRDSNEEADDLIASFCASRPESVRIIVSDDKDFFQLLTDPRVIIYRPGSGEKRFFDSSAAERHWAGLQGGKHPPIPSAHVRMFKSLCGDPSDGIHGVERLRKKVAAALCHHSSVESLLNGGLPGLSDSEKQKVVESAKRIETNFDIVGLKSDLDISKHITHGHPDFEAAMGALEALEIFSVDISGFRKIFSDPKPDPFLVQIPDWLSNI